MQEWANMQLEDGRHITVTITTGGTLEIVVSDANEEAIYSEYRDLLDDNTIGEAYGINEEVE